MIEDLTLLGMHEEAAAYKERSLQCFELWPENLTVWRVFNAVATNWRTVVLSDWDAVKIRYQGIERTAIESTLNLMGIKRRDWPEIFEGIRIMELAALPGMNT